ncbi:MAG: MBOAT family O-acyltransferase [Elainellaceae cyanobacterium]
MLFNSFIFVGFFIVVYSIYLLLNKHHRAQNVLLLAASYLFYSYWDIRFLLLLLTSTVVDFFAAQRIQDVEKERDRTLFLVLSVSVNLTILGFFKYFNFFAESTVNLLNIVGFNADYPTLNIILPVGISFYTFQTLSYTIDVYRRHLAPARNLLDFALFVSFFPQLVAGPIERAKNLLPQIQLPRTIQRDQVNAAIFLILWGYFKKMVIADNLGEVAEHAFDEYTQSEGLDILLSALAFTIQIYGDFSGYSDIARGVSKLMGFELMVNFRLPYVALNPSDFWARWHISLSTWLRDYLYIPLGGNRHGIVKTYRNLLLTMLLGGLWHGAAWNFVIWGGYQGIILILYRLFERDPEHLDPWSGKYSPLRILSKMALMFVLTVAGWMIFRADSASQILYLFSHVGLNTTDYTPELAWDVIFFTLPLIAVQIHQYVTRDLLAITQLKPWIRIPIYGLLLIWIVLFSSRDEPTEFIYFQF